VSALKRSSLGELRPSQLMFTFGTGSIVDRRQLLLPVNDNYFCRFRPRPSARSAARFSAPSVR
jgi:hypothetical protein